MQYLNSARLKPTISVMILASLVWLGGVWGSGTAYATRLATPRNDLNWLQWSKVGEAKLRWFVFDVYTSELRSQTGQYIRGQRPIDQNVALKITYHRSISGDDLLQATQEQWQHLGYAPTLITEWRVRLAEVFPAVQDGDILTFVIDDQRGRFYYRPSAQTDWIALGVLNDAALSEAFISIWLSPQTAYPELRRKLLGETKE